ncbi:MAG: helix-turn-helix domain-containing protein [Rubrivivax sp.]|nr:helix-turn-helix domain-containing protein [Rubrivivax sp.]
MAPPPTTMDDAARTDRDEGGGGQRGEGASAGALLRAARERQGMHIATLAAAIKVAPRKLEALENDRWDELPGPTFTRALAQAVCRALRADPQPVMELLPPADTSMLDSTFGTMNEPFAGKGGREPGLLAWLPRGPWLVAAILLLVAAAVLLWLPAGSWSRLVGGGGSSATAPSGETSTVLGPPPAAAGNGATPAAPAAATAAAGTNAATPSAAGAPAPAQPAPANPTDAAGGAPAAPVPAGDLVVQCSARTWIEVVDGRGRVLVSRNLEAGESLGLDGLAPLQMVVGNAAATRVSYKGKAVDLEPRARDNVARIELK